MAATVIDAYSDQLTQVNPPNYAPLKPNEKHGRIRSVYFTKTFASEAAGLDVALAVIPKGARILQGVITVSATTGSATLAVGLMGKDGSGEIESGVSDNTAALLAAAAVTNTAKVALAATQALKYGYEAQKELYLTLTTAAAAMGTQVLQGHLEYVLD